MKAPQLAKNLTIKTFLPIPLILLATTACQNKYPSFEEAKRACDDWASKGITVQYTREVYSWSDDSFESSTSERFCNREDITRQILGYETDLVTPALKAKYQGKTVKGLDLPGDLDLDYKVVRNFYY